VRPGQFAQVRLSFGVAEFPTDGQSIDDLLNFAALATRQSKKSLGGDKAIAPARVLPYSQPETVKSMPLALVR
jgi:GGDEF domain-containing protein